MYSNASSIKKQDAKAAVEKERGHWKRYRHCSWRKSGTKRGDRWSKEWREKSSFCVIDGSLASQKIVVEGQISKVQRQSRTSRWRCERWFRIVCSIYWTRIISITNDSRNNHGHCIKIPGCAGQAADAASAYTQVKMEDAPTLLNIPKSECTDIWVRLPKHKWPKSWSSMEDPVVPLERNLYGHPLAGLLWERQFEIIILKHGWEKISNWKCLFVHREKLLFSSVYVYDIHQIGWKETKHCSDVECTQQRSRFGRTNIFPWSCIPGMYPKTVWNKQRYCGQLQNHVWIQIFSGKNRKNTMLGKSVYFFMVLRYVMPRNVWNDTVSQQTGRLNNSTKYLLHASMTTASKKKKWNLLENCYNYALKLF